MTSEKAKRARSAGYRDLRGPAPPVASTLGVLLVVEDDELASRLARASAQPIEVTPLLDPLELFEMLSGRAYDVVVLDQDVLVSRGGVVLARVLRERAEHRRIGIVLRGSQRAEARAFADAIVGFDASEQRLCRAIHAASERARARVSAAAAS